VSITHRVALDAEAEAFEEAADRVRGSVEGVLEP